MSSEQLLEDIHELNLSYLLLMQRLINTDREAALFRLKIDESMADLLSRLPVSRLAPLARCNQLLCHFSLSDASQLEALLQSTTHEDLRDVHAAILLGGSERRAANDRRRDDRRGGGDRRTAAFGPPGEGERRIGERRTTERRQGDRRAEDFDNDEQDDEEEQLTHSSRQG